MQSRFGLKDFVLMVLVAGVGVIVLLSMFQADRQWEKLERVRDKLSDVESQISVLKSTIETRGMSISGSQASGATAARDESWARPGVKIEWQEPWSYAADPHGQPSFREGGEFTEIFEGQPSKLTPEVQLDIYGRRVVDLVIATLGAYDPKTLRMRGWLAEAWQIDPEGAWMRVKIDPRARFSDGAPVTAEDVRWSIHDYVMNPQIEAERSRSTLDTFGRAEVVSERVVDFFFKEPYFLNVNNMLTVSVLPKHIYSKLSPEEINRGTGLLFGAGPYKVDGLAPNNPTATQWAPPADVLLVRNEQYWGPRPSLASIRFRAIDNELARLTAYTNGEADMITPSAPQFVSKHEDPEWRKHNQDLNWINMRSGRAGIIWNCGPRGGPGGKPTPFDDKRVRRAMTMLLDRQRMVDTIWKGLGQVAVGFMNPGTPGHDETVKPLPYDVEKAKALLKEAGWEDRNGDRILDDKDGREFSFELTSFGSGEIAERIATFVKDSCAAAGIKCTIRQLDWAAGDPYRKQRDFDAMLMSWGANAPESDPKQIFHSSSIRNQADNFGQWNSPEADAAIDTARREMDPEKRAELWKRFERIMHEEQPYTWVRVAPYLRFIKPEIGNVHAYPKGLEPWEFYRSPTALPSPAN